MIEKLYKIQKDLLEYHDEMKGVSFMRHENTGRLVRYDYSDYTGGAMDAITNLIGVIEKDNS